MIDEAGHTELRTCTDSGEPIHNGPVPTEIVIGGHCFDYLYSLASPSASCPASTCPW